MERKLDLPTGLAEKVLSSLGDIVAANRRALLWRSAPSEPWQVLASPTLPPGPLRPDSPLSSSLLQWVAESGESLLSGDVTRDPDLPDTTSLMLSSVRSVMIVPVKEPGGHCSGLLYADSQAAQVAFSYTDLLRCQQLSRSLQRTLWPPPAETPPRPANPPPASRQPRPTPRPPLARLPALKLRQRAGLIRSLASLLEAGISLLRALEFLSQPGGERSCEVVAAYWLAAVEGGKSLSQAFAESGQPPLLVSLVRAGERTGSLVMVLRRIAESEEQLDHMRQKIQASLLYPTFLVVFCGALLLLVAPAFSRSLGMTSWVGQGLVHSLWLWPLAGAALAWGLTQLRRGGGEALARKLPGLKQLLRSRDETMFTYLLGLQLEVGMDLLAAVAGAAQACPGFVPSGGRRCLEQLKNGRSLHEALASEVPLRPSTCALLAAGEESGQVAHTLKWCSRLLQQQLESDIAVALSLLEPALMLLLGNLVGAVALATLWPMVRLVQTL